VAIAGEGHATPIVWQDRIVVLTAVGGSNAPENAGGSSGEYEFRTICLDRKTGKVLWEKVSRREAPHEGHHETNTYSSGSAVTDGEHIVAFFGSRGLYVYDMEGKLVWEKDLGDMRTRNGFGEGSTPALRGNTLVVLWDHEGDSFVYAFDKATGRELWKQPRDERSGWTTPYIVEHEGQPQVIINGTGAVRAYDLGSGELLWQCSGQTANAIPSVVADSDHVYAMSGFRGSAAYAIRLGGQGDLAGTDRIRWQLNRGTPYVPSPLLHQGKLYFCQGNDARLSCVDAATGEVHYTQERIEGLAGVYASPVGVADRIYLTGRRGATAVLAAGPELKVLAVNQLDDPIDASPAVVGDELFLRSHHHLYCIASEK
jgi:outer membrane protein assembly factor BamB